jgi:2-C-methyl-D-erythritol 2,4-cyclodiphosphate synthase
MPSGYYHANPTKDNMTQPKIRIGQGFDVHALVPGRKCILGGVDIPHRLGLLGHSDADALLHAICDAMLGALALGDIGKHFPDTDPQYKGIDSRTLLRHTATLIAQQGWAVGNVDCTIMAQAPKIAPHAAAMQTNISADLGIEANQVSIKATTTEHLGFTGREEGIAVSVVCLLISIEY